MVPEDLGGLEQGAEKISQELAKALGEAGLPGYLKGVDLDENGRPVILLAIPRDCGEALETRPVTTEAEKRVYDLYRRLNSL